MSEEKVQKVDFKIYAVPVDVKNKYISLAKLSYDNQVWEVLEEGMKRLEDERKTRVPKLEDRVEQLEAQVEFLKTQLYEKQENEKEEENGPKTFGG